MTPHPIRVALYERLAGDVQLAGLLATPESIYHRRVPQDAAFPCLLFNKQAGDDEWTYDDYTSWQVWQIKGIDLAGDAEAAEAIDTRISALLNDHELAIDGFRSLVLRRLGDVDYGDADGADTYHHVGGLFRLVTQPTN